MTLQALMLHIIVVIYVCRKLHWFRPDLSDLVLGVFSSPVRFVIIELDLSHFHELMRDLGRFQKFTTLFLDLYYCSITVLLISFQRRKEDSLRQHIFHPCSTCSALECLDRLGQESEWNHRHTSYLSILVHRHTF